MLTVIPGKTKGTEDKTLNNDFKNPFILVRATKYAPGKPNNIVKNDEINACLIVKKIMLAFSLITLNSNPPEKVNRLNSGYKTPKTINNTGIIHQ